MSDADDEPQGVPEWVVTYGDMMSLLLTFFIMLVSLSQLKDSHGSMRAMMDAIRETFGPTSGVIGSPGRSTQVNSAYGKLHSVGLRAEGGALRASRTSAGNGGAYKTVQRLSHGTVITLGGPTLFQRFDASLTDAMQENLDTIFEVISGTPQRVMIRGHASTEPLPPNAPFVSEVKAAVGRDAPGAQFDQFDLSFARARAVAVYLIERGIDARRLIVSAAGDAEPRVSTRNPDNQKLNRRVDVFLIDSYITRPSSSEASQSSPSL